jgi:hypothetical protein
MIRHSRLLILALLIIPATLFSTPLQDRANDVRVNAWVKPDKIKRGRTVQANVEMDIPKGLHVQSNRPLDKYLVATKLDIEVPKGVRASTPIYPRALLTNLKFAKGKVSVFEGKALIRFNVTVPSSYSGSSAEIKGRLRFQACTDDACFAPITREVKMWVNIE